MTPELQKEFYELLAAGKAHKKNLEDFEAKLDGEDRQDYMQKQFIMAKLRMATWSDGMLGKSQANEGPEPVCSAESS